jgi:hypothetical protein
MRTIDPSGRKGWFGAVSGLFDLAISPPESNHMTWRLSPLVRDGSRGTGRYER